MKRRLLLLSASALALPEARATEAAMQAAIRGYTGGVTPEPGPITIQIAELVENGNAVPVTLESARPVLGLALFNPLNPEPDVIRVAFTPDCPRHALSTRIRLARSQRLVAVALGADGHCWQASVEVIVTLAACVE
jgi:sulfur-oxidizing protein SoxY